ncbi:hypothetical protein LCGC14_2110310 [marine sediment metagenome]|uniref:Uncharacterized protein n=1 Tax=marine sediment metagenome TaxID=412755 RepID=A0A0F9E7D4_9ZZZZ
MTAKPDKYDRALVLLHHEMEKRRRRASGDRWLKSLRIVRGLRRSAKLPGEDKSNGQSVAAGLMLGGLGDVLLWWLVF